MTISLAFAWRPRGELPRFKKHLPQLREAYDAGPKHWTRRVEIAMLIVQSRLDEIKRGGR